MHHNHTCSTCIVSPDSIFGVFHNMPSKMIFTWDGVERATGLSACGGAPVLGSLPLLASCVGRGKAQAMYLGACCSDPAVSPTVSFLCFISSGWGAS